MQQATSFFSSCEDSLVDPHRARVKEHRLAGITIGLVCRLPRAQGMTRLALACITEKEKGLLDREIQQALFKPGSVLLSHCLTAAVASALEGLTSVFGMGTGVAPPVWPPGTCILNRSSQPCSCVIVEDHVYQEQRDVKPHDRLVLVSYGSHEPSTPSLSNSWSTSGL